MFLAALFALGNIENDTNAHQHMNALTAWVRSTQWRTTQQEEWTTTDNKTMLR